MSIYYWSDYPDMGDVNINWEVIDRNNGQAEGATAIAYPGYHFTHWIDEEENVVSYDEHFIPQKVENVYVEAGYGAIFAPNHYSVSFDANGGIGTDIEKQYHSYDDQYQLPINQYTKYGYTFKGWNTKRDGSGTHYANIQEVSGLTPEDNAEVVLYAQWTLNNYTIQYNLNGGTHSGNPTTYNVTSSTKILKNPTRKGYIFKGWYTSNQYKTKITSLSSGNKTLYAKWSKVSVNKAKTPTITNVKGKKLKISYKATTGAKGYQIQYSTSKKFSKPTSITKTTKSYTSKALKKNKTYYVRVRAYKLDSTGAKVYGKWSTVKSKKIIK